MYVMRPRSTANWTHLGAITLHLGLIALAYWLAFLLRFDFRIPPLYWYVFLQTLPVLLVVRFATCCAFGVYRSSWRHSGLTDLAAILKAATLSSLIFVAILLLVPQLREFPRSILLVDWAAAMMLSGV